MSVQVRITIRSQRSGWKQVSREVRNNLEDITQTYGEHTADLASQFAPKRSGELADSIWSDFDPVNLRSIVRADARHAKFNEYGTVFMPATPFMTPALEAMKPLYLEEIRRELLK